MGANPWVWVAGLLAAVIIAGLAIWRGRGGQVGFGPKGITVNIPEPAAPDDVVVAKGATVEGGLGDVTGRKIEGAPAAGTGPRHTDVAEGMVIKPGGTVASITGVIIAGTAGKTVKK